MKHWMLAAFAAILSITFPIASSAQETLRGLIEEDEAPGAIDDTIPPQRIGVPAMKMELTQNGTGSTTGYCFDEYLVAPRRLTRFQQVLAGSDDAVVHVNGGRSMTLKEAVAQGAVSIKAYQLQVMFANKSGSPMSIELKHPVVLWDRPGGKINPAAVRVLESSVADYDARQEKVWRYTTSERLMSLLGHYDGSPSNFDENNISKAVAAYQEASGLVTTNVLDEPTMRQLAADGRRLQEKLAMLGFLDREGNSLKSDLAAQIRAYQRFAGVAPTGKWSSDLGARFASHETLLPQVKALKTNGKSVAEILADGTAPNILTFLTGLRDTKLLIETPQGVELWNRRGNGLKFDSRGRDAALAMDEAAAALAVKGSKADRLVLYPRVARDGKMAMVYGTRTIQLDANELTAYVDGGRIPADLARELDKITVKPATGGDGTPGVAVAPVLVAYRGPLVQGRTGAAGSTLQKLGLEQVDAGKLAKAIDRTYGGRLTLYVSDDLRLGATRLSESASRGSLDRTGNIRFADARPH